MPNFDSIDLEYTWDEDLVIDGNGDLKDTSEDYITSIQNEIRTIMRAEFNDWQQHPLLGCGLSDFRGEPNTKQTAELIKQRIKSRLASTGIVKKQELYIRIIPVHMHQVLIIIKLDATSTSGNSLELGEPLVVSFTYDSLQDSVFFLPVNQTEKDYRGF